MSGYKLRFPVELDAEHLTLLLAALSADLAGKRWGGRRPLLALSAIGFNAQLEHRLEVFSSDQDRLLAKLRSHTPSIRLTELEGESQLPPPVVAVELRLTNLHRPLRTDRASSTASSILGALATAGDKERIELRWLLTGARTPAPVRRIPANERPQAGLLSLAPPTWHEEAEDVRQERHKQAEPLLLAVARIGVWSKEAPRARQLASRVLRAMASVQAPGVRLTVRSIPLWWVRRRFVADATPWVDWPLALNAAELTSLIAWPIDGPQVPGLSLGAARQLAPSRSIASRPTEGAVIADSTFPGLDQPIVLRDRDRLMHTHILGPTGSGKSVLLGHLGVSDMQHGLGLIAIDPRGDFVDYLADHVPSERRTEVIVFNPTDRRPVGYNPLRRSTASNHLVVDHLDHIFGRLFGGNYGPRSSDINRASLLTLVAASRRDEQYTLAELPLLLTNQRFRHRLTTSLKDPTLRDFWDWYDRLGNAQATVIAPLLNKYRAFLLREPVRNVLSQADPGWSLDEVLSKRQILLVRLSAGEIGEEAAQLLGGLLVAGVWQAAQRRTRLAPERRRPVMLIVDEFQNYLHLPTSLGDMLAQARGLALGLTLANQQLGQLPTAMEAEVLANARSRVVFQTNAKDARALAPHLPGISPEDLQHLGPYEVVAQLAVGSNLAPPLTAQTRPPEEQRDVAAEIKQLSRQRFGTDVENIRTELKQRWEQAAPSSSTVIGEVEIGEKSGAES